MFRKQRGQTLVEVIVAVGILLAGVTALITLSIASLKADQVSSRRIIAVNLAREGIEAIRNIRDSNWLAGRVDDCSGTPLDFADDWLTGLMLSGDECASGSHEVVTAFDAGSIAWSLDVPVPAAGPPGQTNRQVYLTPGNLYIQPGPQAAGWTKTIYERSVILTPRDRANQPSEDCTENVTPGVCDHITHFDVLSTVSFTIDGRTSTVEVGTELYNWKP